MVEMLDIYDDNLTHIGSKPREAVHRDGDWHRTFHCWVIHRDGEGQDWLLMQKRAATKDTFANYLDISAAGHYEAGETERDGVRELHEELGLDVAFDDLIPLGRRVSTGIDGAVIDRQFSDVYFYICDKALNAYHYQAEEIAGLVQLPLLQLIALCAGECDSIQAMAVGLGADVVTMTWDDFIPVKDQYLYKIAVLAQRCLNGEKHLVI